MEKNATIIINGRVQGVGYREFVRKNAALFKVSGSVRNLNDGNLEIFLNGDASEVDRFVKFLEEGKPGAANVEHMDVYYEGHKKHRGRWMQHIDGFYIDWKNAD
jgi:acylphosphatase